MTTVNFSYNNDDEELLLFTHLQWQKPIYNSNYKTVSAPYCEYINIHNYF